MYPGILNSRNVLLPDMDWNVFRIIAFHDAPGAAS
jgi:hypothetical protein